MQLHSYASSSLGLGWLTVGKGWLEMMAMVVVLVRGCGC